MKYLKGIIFKVIVSTHYCKFQDMEKIYKHQYLLFYGLCTFASWKTLFKNLARYRLLFLNKLFSSLLSFSMICIQKRFIYFQSLSQYYKRLNLEKLFKDLSSLQETHESHLIQSFFCSLQNLQIVSASLRTRIPTSFSLLINFKLSSYLLFRCLC